MRKAIIFSVIMVIMIGVFSIGVFSGLRSDIGGLPSYREKVNRPYLKREVEAPRLLKYKKSKFDNLSGSNTTVNGIPIKIWLTKAYDKTKSIADYYRNRWMSNGWIVSENKDLESCFINTIDPESKKFMGAFAYGKNQSTIVPIEIDMSKKIKDEWDKDLPHVFKKKKGIHMRSQDGDNLFEKFFYVEHYPLSQTQSNVKSLFKSKGWDLRKTFEKHKGVEKQHILSFSKKNKNCVVNIMKSKVSKYPGSLVSLFMVSTNNL